MQSQKQARDQGGAKISSIKYGKNGTGFYSGDSPEKQRGYCQPVAGNHQGRSTAEFDKNRSKGNSD